LVSFGLYVFVLLEYRLHRDRRERRYSIAKVEELAGKGNPDRRTGNPFI